MQIGCGAGLAAYLFHVLVFVVGPCRMMLPKLLMMQNASAFCTPPPLHAAVLALGLGLGVGFCSHRCPHACSCPVRVGLGTNFPVLPLSTCSCSRCSTRWWWHTGCTRWRRPESEWPGVCVCVCMGGGTPPGMRRCLCLPQCGGALGNPLSPLWGRFLPYSCSHPPTT